MGERLGVSHAVISDYEKGKRFPAPSVLEAMKDITGFQPDFFLRRIEDPFLDSECSFRHRRTTAGRHKDQVRAHAALLGMVVSALKRLLRFPPFDVPYLPASTETEIERAAEECRLHWNLDLNAPILQVGRVLERAGVVIIASFVDAKKIDAFSRCGKNPLVFLNRGAGTRPSRWNFDLAHECGHLVLHREMPTGSVATEREADRFASAFLLPATAFGREFRTRQFSWQHLYELKQRWQVSLAAIVRRARDLQLIDEDTYTRAFQYMSYKRWIAKGEPFEPTFQEPELFITALKALGTTVKKALPEVCSDLHFSQEVFTEVTGIAIPSSRPPGSKVLQFAR
jgi:Zn-dependent peptidase ImmA (M78 family)